MTDPQINITKMPEFNALLDHIYEYGTNSEGFIYRANAFALALLARYGKLAWDAEYPQAAKVCAELYQVIGSLASDLGVFDHPKVIKALDNASNHALVHDDVLPFPSFEHKTAGEPVASIKTLARYKPDTVYIGTGEYVAECVRADDGDYYLAADVDAAIAQQHGGRADG